ncbi:MAG: ubiquinol-cytochrome c reductase iron-sulfur subunit N-terminal domain-containing protein, partial [Pseudomonadota bacterium]
MSGHHEDRRDFLYVATAGVGAVVVASAGWVGIDQMNPSKDVLA